MRGVTPSTEFKRDPEVLENNFLRDYLIEQAMMIYKDMGREVPEKPPESMYHIWQVSCEGVEIVRASNLGDEEKRKQIKEADKDGLVHDLGRIDDIRDLEEDNLHRGEKNYKKRFRRDKHLLRGARRALELGLDKKDVDLAILHNRWGLGRAVADSESMLLFAQRKGFEAVVRYYLDRYGLAGLAIVISDISKAYNDPNNKFMPEISELTSRVASELIEGQVNKGNFTKDSFRYKSENIGKFFMLYAIDFIKREYGVDYHLATENARKRWGVYKDELETNWRDKIKGMERARLPKAA